MVEEIVSSENSYVAALARFASAYPAALAAPRAAEEAGVSPEVGLLRVRAPLGPACCWRCGG